MQTRLIADSTRCGFMNVLTTVEKRVIFFFEELIWEGYQPFKGNKLAYGSDVIHISTGLK